MRKFYISGLQLAACTSLILASGSALAQTDDNNEVPTITVDESSTSDDGNVGIESGNTGNYYATNGDDFLRTSIFTFGPYRFRPRGYGNTDIQFNGYPLQNLQTGFTPFAQLGVLNDVLRDRTGVYGLRPSEYSFGSTNGSTYIDATAANQRKGASVSYYNSNRVYRNRVMATYNSGLMSNGWAYSVSASRRWAQEGYAPGTYFDGMSFYGAVSKVIKKSTFNLTALAAPTYRGLQAAEIQEVFDLAGSNYFNENWGYQNGKKRNAVVDSIVQPIIVASWVYKPSDKTRWTTSIGYKFGLQKRSTLDWYNAANPAGTYYRNLPSYSIYGVINPKTATYNAVSEAILADPDIMQIQWDNLYQSNYMSKQTVANVDGIAGNNFTGRQSLFVLSNRVDDLRNLALNSNISHAVSEKVTLSGGLQAISQSDEYYLQLADLLGGEFFVNFNQFAAQQAISDPTYTQNDLEHPNKLVKVGDKYGYHYTIRTLKTAAWGQAAYSYRKFDVFGAFNLGTTSFDREGFFRNGLFPNNSFGKSAQHNFFTYQAKGGFTYRIDRHHTIFASGAYMTEAPTANNTYIAPKTRDFTVSNPAPYTKLAAEAGYNFKARGTNLRLTGYVTDLRDFTTVSRFYNDDPDIQSFVNYVMQNVNTRSIGIEFIGSKKIIGDLEAIGSAAIGQCFYTDRPNIAIYQDNVPSMVPVTHTVYIKNYYLGVGPQSMYNFTLSYRTRGYWINAGVTFIDRNYVSINPERRTDLAVDLVEKGSQRWNDILTQERLPGSYVVNLAAGKAYDINRWVPALKHKSQLVINATIGNLLNNQEIRIIGFEQLRYDLSNQNPYKFPNKYLYAYGFNFGVSAAIRF